MGAGGAASLSTALRLMLVTDDRLLEDRDLLEVCQAAEAGGVTSIQLRLKRVASRRLLTLARAVRTAIQIPLLVNDRVDVALAAGAAGAHLGPDDLPLAQARRFVPAGFWLGGSVGTESEVPGGAEADYWGIGPVRATSTKSDAGATIGIEGFARLRNLSDPLCPCVAIGGVQPEDVGALLAAGAAGVAVASGILDADDVMAAAARYRAAIPD